MINIQRLNMDSSWWLRWGDTSILIDPWLLGSEVDGFSWLNEQWHATPAVALDKIPSYQFIIISQPYSDHCHAVTLQQLNAVPVYAVPPAYRRLKKELKSTELNILSNKELEWTNVGELRIARLTPKKLFDPIYHALLIVRNEEAILYAPHGFKLRSDQLNLLEGLTVKLLLTSFAYFKIPAIMGGLVNPGTEGAFALIFIVGVEYVLWVDLFH